MSVPRKNIYQPLIFVLLGSFLAFSAWSAWQAADRGSQITDRDYYSKGLKYNATLVEKRAAEVLGWSLYTQLSGHTLTFQITDQEEKTVSGAQGVLHIYLPDTPEGQDFDLKEIFAGAYQLNLPADLNGTLRARVAFERDGAKLNRHLQLNL